MEWIVNLLSDLGSSGIDLFWLPVGIWTIVAFAATGLLKFYEHKISAVYHYHSRVALLWGLAAGVIGTVGLSFIPLQSAGTSVTPLKFIVIQNPISVTATAPTASINWNDPTLWIGLVTALALLTGILVFIKVIIDFYLLKSFPSRLSHGRSLKSSELSTVNKQILKQYKNSIQILFSGDVDVPCTFGLREKYVVLPLTLQHDTAKLNMALCHELAHINNNDYLINASTQIVKAIFSFHPLVHSLAAGIEEYREIYCDQHVIREADISRKHYAELIVEFSPKPVFKTSAAVNMAVRPSTLKKRIQTMNTSNPTFPSFKASIGMMMLSVLMITGLMACSDIEEGGITRSEIQQAQTQMVRQSDNNIPLYIVNGEQVKSTESNTYKLARIKSKYIKNVEVLKGQKAIDAYGQAGKYGVIKIQFIDGIDEETVYADLKEKPDESSVVPPPPPAPQEPIFVAVQKMPELKGGLQALMTQINYPKEAAEAGIEGKVVVSFIINKQGEVENPQIVKSVGGALDQEALRVVKQAAFEPGKQRGKPVRVQYSLPLVFNLAGNGDGTKGTVSSEEMNMQAQKMEVRNLTLSSEGTLTGKIYDKDTNEPIAGTNIVVKGTRQGTATRSDGTFKIENVKNKDGKLVISYTGYTPLVISYN